MEKKLETLTEPKDEVVKIFLDIGDFLKYVTLATRDNHPDSSATKALVQRCDLLHGEFYVRIIRQRWCDQNKSGIYFGNNSLEIVDRSLTQKKGID